jgi:hypothetical protein
MAGQMRGLSGGQRSGLVSRDGARKRAPSKRARAGDLWRAAAAESVKINYTPDSGRLESAALDGVTSAIIIATTITIIVIIIIIIVVVIAQLARRPIGWS